MYKVEIVQLNTIVSLLRGFPQRHPTFGRDTLLYVGPLTRSTHDWSNTRRFHSKAPCATFSWWLAVARYSTSKKDKETFHMDVCYYRFSVVTLLFRCKVMSESWSCCSSTQHLEAGSREILAVVTAVFIYHEDKSDKEILDDLLVRDRYDKRLRPRVFGECPFGPLLKLIDLQISSTSTENIINSGQARGSDWQHFAKLLAI
uniref:Uncharacterized protein n=1 Tax=Timema douglasi TaxID=61478 RepID=A0A7R8ZGG1_TIMDO|nr:unnamed protein product [Timema douglasi]